MARPDERGGARWPTGSAPPRSTGGVFLCGACRASGLCRLGIESERTVPETGAAYTAVCPSEYEGGPGIAHGGWTAGALDEMLGHLPLLCDSLAVTKTLTIEYLRPVPINIPLTGSVRLAERKGRHWHIEGELRVAATDAPLARARGVWAEVDPTRHFARFDAWVAKLGADHE
jgi:acyl-coenzyme A thioesterase PaaI-like protein